MKKKQEKNSSRSMGRYLLRIWIAVASGALIIIGSFAAYTSMNSVKRVVSTEKGTGILFSSNYLTAYDKGENNYTTKIITVSNSDTPSVTVSICNYAQGNVTKANSHTITYTFQATLIAKEGTELTDEIANNYRIGNQSFTKNSEGKYICTITNQQLEGNDSNRNTYDIQLSKADMDHIYIQVEAIPDSGSYQYTDNNKLANIFSTSLNSSSQNTGWSGQFTDLQTDRTPQDYDGFNYEIAGNGSGRIMLTWDSTKLAISPWFLDEMNITALTKEGDSDKKVITFNVGKDEIESYTVQFYWVDKENETADWSAISGYVDCTFYSDTESAAN